MARSKATVQDRDRGWKELRKMAQRVADTKPYAKGGVLAAKDARKGDGAQSNVRLGLIHEFGAPAAGIPERSFLRSTFDANQGEYEVLARKLVQGIYDGKLTEEKALNLLGARFAADVKKRITTGSGIPPPNSRATMMRKAAKAHAGRKGKGMAGPLASPRPLVDTGQLVGSITWEVVGLAGGGS